MTSHVARAGREESVVTRLSIAQRSGPCKSRLRVSHGGTVYRLDRGATVNGTAASAT